MNNNVVEILNTDFAALDGEVIKIERQGDPLEQNLRKLKKSAEITENEWQMEYRLIYSSYKMDYSEN